MKIKQAATLTINEYEDGTREALIMSRPDGNDIEEMLRAVMEIIDALIKAQAEKEKK
jgi:hypothetical protein